MLLLGFLQEARKPFALFLLSFIFTTTREPVKSPSGFISSIQQAREIVKPDMSTSSIMNSHELPNYHANKIGYNLSSVVITISAVQPTHNLTNAIINLLLLFNKHQLTVELMQLYTFSLICFSTITLL